MPPRLRPDAPPAHRRDAKRGRGRLLLTMQQFPGHGGANETDTSEGTLDSPGMHTQRKAPRSSRHVPWLWHGLLSHSLMLISQRGPVKPLEQLHLRGERRVVRQCSSARLRAEETHG